MRHDLITKDAYQLFHDGVCALSYAEDYGFLVDVAYIENQIADMDKQIADLEESFWETSLGKDMLIVHGANVNYNSNNQLGKVLYEYRKIEPVKTTAKGKGAVDEESFTKLGIPDLEIILSIRKIKKVRDTYMANYLREQVNGIIHCSYNLHSIITYRSSCSDPNLQNVPKRDKVVKKLVRSAFIPRPGHHIVELDFHSMEVSIAACYHKDPTMIKYLTTAGTDMHGDVATQIFFLSKIPKTNPMYKELRQIVKGGFIFAQFYGDWWGSCAPLMWGQLTDEMKEHLAKHGVKELGVMKDHKGQPTGFYKRVKDIETDFWENRFPVYNQWKKDVIKEYGENGYIDTLTGFRCSAVMDSKQVTNYPVQGSAFHCMLWTFIETDKIMRKEGWKSRLMGQVHDSIIMDVADDELEYVLATVYRLATIELPKKWKWINVPLGLDAEVSPIDRPWSELEEYDIKGMYEKFIQRS